MRNALMDTTQAASNSVAGMVSGPVDLITAGLRALGVPVPRNALMSSEWMQERGLTRPVQQGAPRVIGETLGMVAPTAIAAKAPQIAAGVNQMMANAAAPRTLNPQTGAIVWHGSPHKFDKFDSSKIGTGEGAQAYGHGLYFAEAPEVAKAYRNQLTTAALAKPDGSVVQADGLSGTYGIAARYLAMEGGYDGAMKKAALNFKGDKLEEVTSHLMGMKFQGVQPWDGGLYKVDLPDSAIARMLDWDKPLSQQAPGVADTLRSLAADSTTRKMLADDTRASAAYKLLGLDLSSADEAYQGSREVARALRERGVPGLRYLDGGSRGAGQGTSNFVVFPGEENLLRILERNGVPLK